MPIVVRSLGVVEYGIWSQIAITSSLLIPVLSLGLMNSTVRYLGSESPAIRERSFVSVLLATALAVILIGLGLLKWERILTIAVFGSYDFVLYTRLLILYLFSSVMLHTTLSYYRACNRIKIHSIAHITSSLLELLVVIVVLSFFHMSLLAAICGMSAVNLVICTITVVPILAKARGWHLQNLAILKPYLIYGLPFVPDAFLLWVLNSSDRYVITYFRGFEEVGRYSAAYRLALLPKLILAALSFVLYPTISMLWENGKREQAQHYIETSLKYYTFIAVPAAAGLTCLGPALLRMLGTSQLSVGMPLLAFLVSGVALMGAYELFVYIIYLREQTRYLPAISLLSASTNLALNLWLVPRYGILSAAIATLVAYFMQFTLVILLSRRGRHIGYDLKDLFKCIIAAGSMVASIAWINPHEVYRMLGAATLGTSVYIIAMILMGAVGRRELSMIHTGRFGKGPG